MHNDITPHLALPLPHPENDQEVDVLRIRDAFSGLDSKIAALDLLLASDDLTLDALQELVAAIKAARTELGALDTLVAERLAALDTTLDVRLAAQQAAHTAALNAQAQQASTATQALVQRVHELEFQQLLGA